MLRNHFVFCFLGEYQKACEYLDLSIATTAYVYGDKSIEQANELQKFAELLVRARQMHLALEKSTRARDIMLVHYGEGHTVVQEIEEFVRYLQMMSACAR